MCEGNSGFQTCGNARGSVILPAFRWESVAVCLAADTAARLKAPQDPGGVTDGGMARPQGSPVPAWTLFPLHTDAIFKGEN